MSKVYSGSIWCNNVEYIHDRMHTLIFYARLKKDFELIWDDFWNLSKQVDVHIDYYDPDTSYEEDIMARYNAIGDYLKVVGYVK